MTKFCLTAAFALFLVFSAANMVFCQLSSQTMLNPPEWIHGEWKSSRAESDPQKFESFVFSATGIKFSTGSGEKTQTLDFIENFKGYEVTETIEPKLYRVTFTRDADEFIYEFKWQNVSPRLSGQTFLSYSVTENKKIVREHSKSNNELLIREERCG